MSYQSTDNHSTNNGSVCTTCPYCGVGCGVNATLATDGSVNITGDKSHPANFGKLCAKGYALADTLGQENRLLSPRIADRDVPWSVATEHIADKLAKVMSEYGPEAIGFYVSGQLLTEDYYVVNKFVKGFLGTANIDTNSRLCMASSVAGHKRAFGSDTVPGCYEDLEAADLVVLVGSNLAWCHPVLFQRLEQAKSNNPDLTIVVIDPRKTATAELADIHLPIRTGGESDAVLFSGLLHYLQKNNALDHAWIDEHTTGFGSASAMAKALSLEKVAERVGLTSKQVEQFYAQFLRTQKVVTVYSQGVNQSHRGTDTVNSIINVHLATGRIGRKGCGPFSVTGQPNAMGGREVGGLANMLACHMDIENETHRSIVQRYWGSPAIASKPGLKAVDMFDAVQSGQIKALWVMATNPVDSMPLANDVAQAISNCPFVVVSDVVAQTDTVQLANVQLPAQAWSEKSGTVTNSERRISRQRAFKSAPTHAKPDWWAVSQVARSMGFGTSFNYQTAAEIFKEYAGLSSFENSGTRDFNIGHYADIDQADYDALMPFQWPKPKSDSQTSAVDSKRFFSDGKFFTLDGKARFVAIDISNKSHVPEPSISVDGTNETGFVLNTGRIRDQWHTMTRTGSIAKLSAHTGEPFAELNPSDAKALKIDDASLLEVFNRNGSVTVRVLVTNRTQPGSIFIPMHWNNQFASNARVNVLVRDLTDPVSGQPALKNQRVSIRRSKFASYGFMLTREKPDCLDSFDYWAIAPIEQGWKTEFASSDCAQSISDLLIDKTSESADESLSNANLISYRDPVASNFRHCWFSNESLVQAVYLAPNPVSVARETIVSLFSHQFKASNDRIAVVSGAGFADRPDTGATVCSCLNVGSKTIQQSIDSGCQTVQSIGVACGAGTQCGTCRSELATMIKLSVDDRQLEKLAG